MAQREVTYRGVSPAELRDTIEFIAAPANSSAKKLVEIWNARAADGLVMGRDVPARALAPLLSRMMVWEPIDHFADFRVRLAGDEMHRRFDGEIKGRLMSELFPPQNLPQHIGASKRAIVTDSPVILYIRLSCATAEALNAEVVILPVVSPDRSSTWALSVAFFS